uniref:Uncharacterized protein n=1 Tax=Arundo donax TaxID=35708 RepID=A0A0A9EHX2_ARUDO
MTHNNIRPRPATRLYQICEVLRRTRHVVGRDEPLDPGRPAVVPQIHKYHPPLV